MSGFHYLYGLASRDDLSDAVDRLYAAARRSEGGGE